MRFGLTLAAATVVGLFGFGYASSTAVAAQADKPVPSSEASIKAGATTFGRSCAPCHGLRGRGDGIAAPPGAKPSNLTDAEWKHGSTDADIYKVISNGLPPYDIMKPMAKVLPPNDIWNVINYIRSLVKPPVKK